MSDERSFSDVKVRLDEIVDAISDDDISLDDALSLYEEAVSLGLIACDLSETDIFGDSEAEIESGSVTEHAETQGQPETNADLVSTPGDQPADSSEFDSLSGDTATESLLQD